MASTSEQLEGRITLHCVSWQSYQGVLAALGDRRLRHTYDRGGLEMMSPGREHERLKRLLGRLFEMLAFELDIPIQSTGSTTLSHASTERGLEPDETYYIAHELQLRTRVDYDPDHDPPPDLAIEIDVTSNSIPRMPVYEAIGVPEIWRCRNGIVSFHQLQSGGGYREVERSAAFPLLRPADIQVFIDQRHSLDEHSILRSFLDWVRRQSPSA